MVTGSMMLSTGSKVTDLGWFEGVICRKVDGEKENSTLVWTVRLLRKETRESIIPHFCFI